MSDPFRHHPGLRGKIRPAAESFFRTFTTEKVRTIMAERGIRGPFSLSQRRRARGV